MKYSTYEQIAEQYIIEQYGSLEILKSYNYSLEDKASQFIFKQML